MAPGAGGDGKANADAPLNPVKAPAFRIDGGAKRTMYFKGMVYGEYGAGKTWLWGTAADEPQMRDVLIISAEAGDMTLYDPDHQFHLIDVVKVTNYATVARVYDFLKLHCSLRDSTNPDDNAEERLLNLQKRLFTDGVTDPDRLRRYRTVILDSLTEIEAYCMNHITGVNDATKMDEESSAPEWAEYRKQHTMVQRLIRNFRDLPMHILFTCARAYREDELKRSLYSPMMTGKLGSQVQGFMDLVGYLVMGTAKDDDTPAPRRLYIQPGPRFSAKSRFSRYKKTYFDNPSVGGMLRAVGVLESPEGVSSTGGPSAKMVAASATTKSQPKR